MTYSIFAGGERAAIDPMTASLLLSLISSGSVTKILSGYGSDTRRGEVEFWAEQARLCGLGFSANSYSVTLTIIHANGNPAVRR